MKRRVARIQTVQIDDGEPEVLGSLIDPGDGTDPFGDTAGGESMLQGGDGDRRANFERFYSGWSNGYTQTVPAGKAA